MKKAKPVKRHLCYLCISSWVGVSIGAVHYYGHIKMGIPQEPESKDSQKRYGIKEVEVEHPLTQKEATYLNKQQFDMGCSHRYRRGELSGRFSTVEQLRKYAAVTFAKEFGADDVLLVQDWAMLDPAEILVGPEELKAEVAEIVKACEENDWWEGDEKTMKALFKRYWKLMNSYGLNWKRED